jgi:DNA polymerase/3'-5' exonuclease PolX
MNVEAVKLLRELSQISHIVGDSYRTKAYQDAIAGINSLDWELTADKLISTKISGVGKNIKKKLLEYVKTGSISELVKLRNTKEVKAYDAFTKIAGVGPTTIMKWMTAGIYTLPDLRKRLAKKKITLTHMQKYGLLYYADLNDRIPRDEVRQIGEFVQQLLEKITHDDLISEIAGSYRRGNASSGDIDIIMTSKIFKPMILSELLDVLGHDHNFIDALSVGKERVTFLYKSPMSHKVRQVDVLNLPFDQYYSGVLYFTGNADFGVALRGYAKLKGYKLNQKGLFANGKVITPSSEKEIFDILDLVYIEPEDRNEARIIPL